jgi:hypothetical protein
MKLRYAIRFPELQSTRPRRTATSRDDPPSDDDPDLRRPGVIPAPRALADEVAALVSFKTATLTPFGYRRRGVWGR